MALMKITIQDFDPIHNWNPTVELTDDYHKDIEIYFPEFPPPHLEDHLDDFDEVLTEQIGVQVEWQDREFFVILDASEAVFHKTVEVLTGFKATR